MKRVHAARGSCRGRRAAPGIAPRGARAYAARHPRAPIPAGSGCRAPRSKLPDMHGLRPKPRSRQAGGGAQAGARGQRLAAQGAVLPARPAAVCFTASHVPPPPPALLCSLNQLYEATKRATQDVTMHAKEAAGRAGLKDVRATGEAEPARGGSRACAAAHRAASFWWGAGGAHPAQVLSDSGKLERWPPSTSPRACLAYVRTGQGHGRRRQERGGRGEGHGGRGWRGDGAGRQDRRRGAQVRQLEGVRGGDTVGGEVVRTAAVAATRGDAAGAWGLEHQCHLGWWASPASSGCRSGGRCRRGGRERDGHAQLLGLVGGRDPVRCALSMLCDSCRARPHSSCCVAQRVCCRVADAAQHVVGDAHDLPSARAGAPAAQP